LAVVHDRAEATATEAAKVLLGARRVGGRSSATPRQVLESIPSR